MAKDFASSALYNFFCALASREAKAGRSKEAYTIAFVKNYIVVVNERRPCMEKKSLLSREAKANMQAQQMGKSSFFFSGHHHHTQNIHSISIDVIQNGRKEMFSTSENTETLFDGVEE